MLMCSPACAAAGEFFQIKNENPLLRGLYLPLPSDMRAGDGTGFSMNLAVANTINVESRAGERLFVDGEAATLRLAYDARLAPRWRYRLTLPLIRDSGGSLDPLIERWHGAFGLKRGQRPKYPRDQLEYFYNGIASIDLNRSSTGIGDASAEVGWFAVDAAARSLSVWGGLEAPTGSVAALTGNGAWDASLWMHAALRGTRWQVGAEAGLVRPFGDDVFGGAARRTAAFGRVAASWLPSPAWSLRLQLDAQSARLKQTQLRFLGPSMLLSAGVQWRVNPRWSAQLGFTEDAAVNTAPDVTFFIGMRRAAPAH